MKAVIISVMEHISTYSRNWRSIIGSYFMLTVSEAFSEGNKNPKYSVNKAKRHGKNESVIAKKNQNGELNSGSEPGKSAAAIKNFVASHKMK